MKIMMIIIRNIIVIRGIMLIMTGNNNSMLAMGVMVERCNMIVRIRFHSSSSNFLFNSKSHTRLTKWKSLKASNQCRTQMLRHLRLM
jgi:hypothetical protein